MGADAAGLGGEPGTKGYRAALADGGLEPGKGRRHELRPVHRARTRFRAVGADRGTRLRGPSAIHARTHPQGAARRPGRLAAGLIERAGGKARDALAATERALAAIPKVSGGTGQLYLAPPLAKVFDTAEKIAKKAGDSFVTVERLLLALAMEKDAGTAKILPDAGVTPQTLNAAIEEIRKGRTADSASAESQYDALKKYTRDLTQAARDGKLDPVIGRDEEIRRTIQVLARRTKNNPVLIGEPGRRQDRDRRGPRAPHRQRRRAGEPEGQEAARARHWARSSPAPNIAASSRSG